MAEIWQNLIDKWESLLEAELSPIRFYQSDVWENNGVESVRLSDGESEQEGESSLAETRFYTAQLTYYLKMKPGKDRLKELRKAFNRINAVVNQNRHPIADYVFHDWRTLDTVINGDREDEEPDAQSTGIVRMTLQATVTEAIS